MKRERRKRGSNLYHPRFHIGKMTFSCCRIISTRAIERGSRIKRNDLRIWVSGDLVALFSFRSPITAPGPLLENEKRLFAMGNNAVPYTTLRVSRFVRCALVVVLRAVLRKCLEVADPERRRKSGWKQGAGVRLLEMVGRVRRVY